MADLYLRGASQRIPRPQSDKDIPDEVQRFLDLAPVGRDIEALDWWKMHEKEFPVCAKMARDILAIPASSAECERIFSAARNISNWNQGRTSKTTLRHHVEVKLFLRYNRGSEDYDKREPSEFGLTGLDRLLFG